MNRLTKAKRINTAKNRRRRICFRLLLLGLGGIFGLVLAELVLAVVAPQEMLSPRYRFSPEYGVRPFPNVTMSHSKRGAFHFRYSTNRNGWRGPDIPISNRYDRPNVVILGDSRSFGMGVDDAQEYPYLLQQQLDGKLNIVNLGCPSWGLTQQIRCFYEMGQLYQPPIVILQTNGNDVDDNQINKVTTIEDGRFAFHDSLNSANWFKRYLSRSWIQKSHLYNLVRDDLYQWLTRRTVHLSERTADATFTSEVAQQFYNELLTAFAEDLNRSGIKLIVFSHEGDFRRSPVVQKHILELDSAGLVTFCPLDPWLEGRQDYGSPEGHVLGRLGHEIAADGLAELLSDAANSFSDGALSKDPSRPKTFDPQVSQPSSPRRNSNDADQSSELRRLVRMESRAWQRVPADVGAPD